MRFYFGLRNENVLGVGLIIFLLGRPHVSVGFKVECVSEWLRVVLLAGMEWVELLDESHMWSSFGLGKCCVE